MDRDRTESPRPEPEWSEPVELIVPERRVTRRRQSNDPWFTVRSSEEPTAEADGPEARPPVDRPAFLALIVVVGVLVAVIGLWRGGSPDRAVDAATAATVTFPPTSAPQLLTTWTGPVEHLFFHPLIIRPDLAFGPDDKLAQGFRDYFVTTSEFRAMLDQLYANGWTLVDIHRAVRGEVRVPPGRRPLVLSIDDVNYYDYSRDRGVGWRLVLDASGNVKVEVHDDLGRRVSDDDIIPMVDAFVAGHPDFSADGAKGVIALTGYEGLFGERIHDVDASGYDGALTRAKEIAARLKATGWTFASHSYSHIDLNRRSIKEIRRDSERWSALATPVIGPTDVFIYAYGAAPAEGSAKTKLLRDLGFTIQCGIDEVARLKQHEGVSYMSRRHIDGIAFAEQRTNLATLFDVDAVIDRAARAGRPSANG